eukprot:TRINITY_DN4386_c0_g1_i1.p1 TRINITY_DN4386_c0_g1~~TRINITY_DN4386_c0_g1_i1.p1  ORF type:complete len:105 (-),score=22.91 TRINITY_DN4386_c0_g1_i1:1356-1670(-)
MKAAFTVANALKKKLLPCEESIDFEKYLDSPQSKSSPVEDTDTAAESKEALQDDGSDIEGSVNLDDCRHTPDCLELKSNHDTKQGQCAPKVQLLKPTTFGPFTT